jgi:hypothetical protein
MFLFYVLHTFVRQCPPNIHSSMSRGNKDTLGNAPPPLQHTQFSEPRKRSRTTNRPPDNWGMGSIPSRCKIFLSSSQGPDRLMGPPSLLSGNSSPGDKAVGAWSSPQSADLVKNAQGNASVPHTPSWSAAYLWTGITIPSYCTINGLSAVYQAEEVWTPSYQFVRPPYFQYLWTQVKVSLQVFKYLPPPWRLAEKWTKRSAH